MQKFSIITKRVYHLLKLPVIKIKEFNNKETYLLFGILPIYKKDYSQNIFLVFNTACFGDVLLCNSLCQNIKQAFPDSKTVFIVDKPFCDVAKNQACVDEVIVYDKKGEHKGFAGMFKFVKEFPYKNTRCSFITYRNERNYMVSKLIGSQRTIMANNKDKGKMQYRHKSLLEKFLGYPCNDLPIKFETDDKFPKVLENQINKDENYTVLCTLTKNPLKDIPVETAIDLVKKLNDINKKVVFTGIGKNNLEYAEQLKQAGCEFINLVNKTDIQELARVIKNSQCLISVDTGTMHLGYALGVKTICIFYEENKKDIWAPDEKLYPYTKVLENPSVNELISLLGSQNSNVVEVNHV